MKFDTMPQERDLSWTYKGSLLSCDGLAELFLGRWLIAILGGLYVNSEDLSVPFCPITPAAVLPLILKHMLAAFCLPPKSLLSYGPI